MKPIPLTPEITALARCIVWFEPPEKAVSDPVRFMAYDPRSWAYWNSKMDRFPPPPLPTRRFAT